MRKDSSVQNIKNVILGAGLTGLSAAYHSGTIIFEKEKEVGGTCRSFRSDGFIFDLGIHVLHTKNRYVLGLLNSEKQDISLRKKARSAWIYSHGVFTKYPFQANTFGLPKEIIADCIIEFIKAQGGNKQSFVNYQDWIYSQFGKGIADKFYLPYSEKFWTVKANELTTDWLNLRVPRPRLEDVIRGAASLTKKEFGPNVLFRYPHSGGIQVIARALIKPSSQIMFSKEAFRIELDKKVLHFTDKTKIKYDNLVSTIPLPELFKIAERVPRDILEAVKALRHNSILCINLGVRRQNISSKHWIYFPEQDFAFFRISFPRNFSSGTVPKGQDSVQAEISYSKDRPIKDKDIVSKVISDLIKAKILKSSDKIKLISKQDIKYAYVIYDHCRLANLKIISCFLKKHDIYNAGRYGQWEYLWMDEAILSGKNILKNIKYK